MLILTALPWQETSAGGDERGPAVAWPPPLSGDVPPPASVAAVAAALLAGVDIGGVSGSDALTALADAFPGDEAPFPWPALMLTAGQVVRLTEAIAPLLAPEPDEGGRTHAPALGRAAADALSALGDAFCARALAGATSSGQEARMLAACARVGAAHRGVFLAGSRRTAAAATPPDAASVARLCHSLCLSWTFDAGALTATARALLAVAPPPAESLATGGGSLLRSLFSLRRSAVPSSTARLPDDLATLLRLRELDDRWSRSTLAVGDDGDVCARDNAAEGGDNTTAFSLWLPNCAHSLNCAAATEPRAAAASDLRSLGAVFAHLAASSSGSDGGSVLDASALLAYGTASAKLTTPEPASHIGAGARALAAARAAAMEAARVILLARVLSRLGGARAQLARVATSSCSAGTCDGDGDGNVLHALLLSDIARLRSSGVVDARELEVALDATCTRVTAVAPSLVALLSAGADAEAAAAAAAGAWRALPSQQRSTDALVASLGSALGMRSWQTCGRSGLLIPLSCSAASVAVEVRLPSHTLPLPAAVSAAHSGLAGAPSLVVMWRAAVLAQSAWTTAWLPASVRLHEDAAHTAEALAAALAQQS